MEGAQSDDYDTSGAIGRRGDIRGPWAHRHRDAVPDVDHAAANMLAGHIRAGYPACTQARVDSAVITWQPGGDHQPGQSG